MAGGDEFEQHPDFPALPASVPLAYSLAMKACLDPQPLERPTCADLLRLLADLTAEVAEGSYVNSKGLLQVCCRCGECNGRYVHLGGHKSGGCVLCRRGGRLWWCLNRGCVDAGFGGGGCAADGRCVGL